MLAETEREARPGVLVGRCYCGAVSFRVEDAFVYASNCHCSNCRRTTGSAYEQVEPAPVAGRESGSRFQLSVSVDDVDAACDLLQRRGATLLTGPADRPWDMRAATFVDPDGHSWEIAQELAP